MQRTLEQEHSLAIAVTMFMIPMGGSAEVEIGKAHDE